MTATLPGRSPGALQQQALALMTQALALLDEAKELRTACLLSGAIDQLNGVPIVWHLNPDDLDG